MKQQQLTFEKGITNIPSDNICSDNSLEDEIGMIYHNGEHRVIQNPATFIENPPSDKILYIHKYNDEDRYIGRYVVDNNEVYGVFTKSGTALTLITVLGRSGTEGSYAYSLFYESDSKITSIGKTLIVFDSAGPHYFLWKSDSEGYYYHLGNKIPEPTINLLPCLGGKVTTSGSYSEIVGTGDPHTISDQGKYNDLVLGLYAENKKKIKSVNAFCGPFMVRYAIELYDGSYTLISNPIMILTSMFHNSYAVFETIGGVPTMRLYTNSASLAVKASYDYSLWGDIVKDVVLFASGETELYNLGVDQQLKKVPETDPTVVEKIGGLNTNTAYWTGTEVIYAAESLTNGYYKPLTNLKTETVEKNLVSSSVFYRLCSIGTTRSDYLPEILPIEENVVTNLTTQTQLPNDDYFSRCSLVPKFVYTYNSRVNISSISRGFFEGFDNFLPYDNNLTSTYHFYVTINTDKGNVVVRHTKSTKQKQGLYFYYPDSRAKRVRIYKVNSPTDIDLILDTTLKAHSGLNGAYYFAGMPTSNYTEPTTDGTLPSYDNSEVELLPNYILQSEVNNPFIFPAAGYFKVGTGKILGMSTITQALSQGQFGQYPLLVFSESGIWALGVSSTGTYSNIDTISREVALKDNPCITQTDGAVFFASKKGLMVVVGSEVRCVSEQLSGKSTIPFASYLEDAMIAYDYRDSLLWILSSNHDNTVCWVYSIKSGAFARFNFGNSFTNIVNNYPDTLIQNEYYVLSLMDRANINSDVDSYTACIKTRPMKLENAFALKSIMQMKHVFSNMANVHLELRVLASNDLNSWTSVTSLRGTPYKYYKFRYDLTNMSATDTFSGTMLLTEERRTNKLR